MNKACSPQSQNQKNKEDVFFKPFLKNQKFLRLSLSQHEKIGLLKQEVLWSQQKPAIRKINKLQQQRHYKNTGLFQQHCVHPTQQIKEILQKVSIAKENVSQNIEFLILNKKIHKSKTKSQLVAKNQIHKSSPQSPQHRKSISHFQIFKMDQPQNSNCFQQKNNNQIHSYNILSKIVSKSSRKNIFNEEKKSQIKVSFDKKRSQTMQIQKPSTNSSNTQAILNNLKRQRNKNIHSANKSLGKDKAEALVRRNSLFLLNFIRQKQKQIQFQKNKNDFNPHINHMANMTNQININQVKREHDNQKKLKKQKNIQQRIKYSAKIQRKSINLIDQKLQKQQQKIQPW